MDQENEENKKLNYRDMTDDERLEILARIERLYKEEGYSQALACKECGITPKTYLHWCRKHNVNNAAILNHKRSYNQGSYKKKPTPYKPHSSQPKTPIKALALRPDQLAKVQKFLELKKQHSTPETARLLNVPQSTIYAWVKRYEHDQKVSKQDNQTELIIHRAEDIPKVDETVKPLGNSSTPGEHTSRIDKFLKLAVFLLAADIILTSILFYIELRG